MSGDGTVVFLHGADMAPDAVRAAWPAAQFMARAWVSAADLPGTIPPGIDAPKLWGILISVPDGDGPGAKITATTDDGRSVIAAPVTEPGAISDPVATVAEARYWELPPAYVSSLAAVVPTS